MVKVIEDDEVERFPFIKMEELRLENLPKLKAFCDRRCALQSPSLRRVFILKCPLMERFSFGILTSPISSDNFENLESIDIGWCSMLEQVVLWNEGENGKEDINALSSHNYRRVTFPVLEKLRLNDLPRLTSFCKGIQSVEFPLLTKMEIRECPNLKSLVSLTDSDHKKCFGAMKHDADDSLHLFCKSQVAFGWLGHLHIDGYENISSERSLSLWCDQISMNFFAGLVYLTVRNCGNVKSLFSPSIAGNLVNLRHLTIKSCREMVKVIEDEEFERSPFIKLELLTLKKLPKLKVFCDWRRCALQLPSLSHVFIRECPDMERFSFGSLTTPNLKIIIKDGKQISDYTTDLNGALFGSGDQ